MVRLRIHNKSQGNVSRCCIDVQYIPLIIKTIAID